MNPMDRIAARAYGSSAVGAWNEPNGGASVQASVTGGVSVGTGDSRWSGIIVVALVAIVLVGYHGLKI